LKPVLAINSTQFHTPIHPAFITLLVALFIVITHNLVACMRHFLGIRLRATAEDACEDDQGGLESVDELGCRRPLPSDRRRDPPAPVPRLYLRAQVVAAVVCAVHRVVFVVLVLLGALSSSSSSAPLLITRRRFVPARCEDWPLSLQSAAASRS
jgi:hypothetical protein